MYKVMARSASDLSETWYEVARCNSKEEAEDLVGEWEEENAEEVSKYQDYSFAVFYKIESEVE